MKRNFIICASLAAALAAVSLTSAQNNQDLNRNNADETAAPGITETMYFNSVNVVEAFYYGDPDNLTSGANVYYITYDDMDAGHDYAVIRVSETTYLTIIEAQENAVTLTGELYLSHIEESSYIYSLEY